jgi:DNA-binding winged helix-turn-helix (wHTH) protein
LHPRLDGAAKGSASASPDVLHIGDIVVRPLAREMIGPVGAITLEPRVISVLLFLAQGQGEVVTREGLLAHCWDGVVVGQDALNRAIALLRKALVKAGGGVVIETISKSGYRLAVHSGAAPHLSRRRLVSTSLAVGLGVGVAGVAGVAGVGIWRQGRASHARAVADAGRALLRNPRDQGAEKAISLFEEAVSLAPDDAGAWGGLALAWRNVALATTPANRVSAIEQAREAIHRALALDRRQGDALAAQATLTPMFRTWAETHDRLEHALAMAPGNWEATCASADLALATGRGKASLAFARALVRDDPGAPRGRIRLLRGLWATGQTDAAARLATAALRSPQPPHGLWATAIAILGFAGQTDLALAAVDAAQAQQAARSHLLGQFHDSIVALASRQPEDVSRAVETVRANVALFAAFGDQGMLTVSGLGALDATFEVADAYFLGQGPLAPSRDQQRGNWLDQTERQNPDTGVLFLPPTAAMRLDRRFITLCRALGLTQYWLSRERPDFLRDGLLPGAR